MSSASRVVFEPPVDLGDFPILNQTVHGRRLAYLDNAATTQRPRQVIEALDRFYRDENANVHRAVHALSQKATEHFDAVRENVAEFINARESEEILFTKGCTEAINLVAHSWGVLGGGLNGRPVRHVTSEEVRVTGQAPYEADPPPSDSPEILVSTMEHHANLIPWQIAAAATGAIIRPIPISDEGVLDMDAYRAMISPKVKLVCVKHVCNAIGTVNPVAEMTGLAHAVGAKVMVDGAQALAHETIDVLASGVDFFSMSSHKTYGPMGVGALYVRREILDHMPPYQAGGDMIREVTFERTIFADLPNRFEPGTPHVAGVIAFGEALTYLRRIGIERIRSYEHSLADAATSALASIPGVRIIGQAPGKSAIVSFVVEGIHPHDVGTVLDKYGVAVRAGHHCCQPLMRRIGLPATVRASFAAYSTETDIHQLVEGIQAARGIFA